MERDQVTGHVTRLVTVTGDGKVVGGDVEEESGRHGVHDAFGGVTQCEEEYGPETSVNGLGVR